MDIYSQLKPAWHLDRIQQMREGRRPAPVHVQLVLSDLCNHDCGFCAYRISSGLSNELFPVDGERNPNRRITTEKAIEIIDDCASLGVKAIQFTGGGEPTVHKDHLQLFAHAQARGMKTSLVTNGVKLDVDHPAVRAMTWVRVSVDAGTEETYCRTRRVPPNHWRTVWKNIRALVKTCDGVVSVGYVVTPENFSEVSAAAVLARDAGVANMRVGAVFSSEGTGYYTDRPAIRAAIDDAEKVGFEIADLFDRRMADLEAGSPTEPSCGYQHLTTYVGADLGVYRCCNTSYTRAGKVADLGESRLLDVFTGPLPEFDATQCRFCQFRGQNEVLAALMNEPTHSEFV